MSDPLSVPIGGPPVSRTGGTAASYGLAFIGLLAAIAIRGLLDRWMGDTLPLVTLFGAIAAAVWLGGRGPAVAVAVLGYLVCDYLFIQPRYAFAFGGVGGVIGLLAYLFTSSLIVVFGEAARRSQGEMNTRRELLHVTLRSIGDGVITTDADGCVTSMNAVAESLTGWTERDAVRRPLSEVFRIVNETTRATVASPVAKALSEGTIVGLANHTVLIRKSGDECPIDDSAAPIRDERGRVSGCVLIFRDVSQQRTVEREKAGQLLTARLLASIIESSDDAIISKSLDGVIRSWNAGAERLFGHTAAQAVGQHISLIIPPDRLSEEDRIIASLKAGQRIDHFETERVRADGGRRIVSLTISPIRDDSGTVVGASKIVRDVTVQRRVEQRERQLLAAAADANAKFHAFFEQAGHFAAITDIDGTIVEANRQAADAFGVSREAIVGQRFWDGPSWSYVDQADRLRDAIRHAAAGDAFRVEMSYAPPIGEARVVDLAIHPIRDEQGDVRFLAWSGVDITDRKRAEADREKFVTLVEHSTDFIGMCDLDGVPFFVNRAGLELVGLDDVEEARRTPVEAFFFPEDRHRVVHEFFPSVLEHGHGEIEVRFRNFKTGEAHWMAYKVLVLPDAAGRPAAFATVSQDVTERKRLEDHLRQLAADLSEADRRKNEFLAILAHELRNPLAPISNAARALQLGGGEVVQSASEMLERQVGQMARLVDDLLDMSRITRGRIELRRQSVELAPVVHQAVEAVRAQYTALNQELTVSLPSRPLHLDADPARLAQVIGNLLNNASKFTDRGGHVWLTVEDQPEQAVIRVRDNGIGIAAEHLPRLFEMFTQVDTSLERSRDGLGIGLTLVKTLVEMHGGSVEARSEGPGGGSEFIVRLPVIATADRQSPQAESAAPAPNASRRVLIVDDSEDGAESLAMLLQFAGHQTWTAHDGVEAITMTERVRPDAVLLDIGLPRMDGYEACRRIRKEPWGKDLAVVALTGWGQEEDRRLSREAGFTAHFVKPVDHEVLLEFLETLPPTNRNAPIARS